MLNAMAHMVAKTDLALQQRDLTAMLAGAMVECATHNCTLSGRRGEEGLVRT